MIITPIEFLNSLQPTGLPQHHFQLKIGAPIMLLRNLDPHYVCHWTRLTVKTVYPHLILQITRTDHQGCTINTYKLAVMSKVQITKIISQTKTVFLKRIIQDLISNDGLAITRIFDHRVNVSHCNVGNQI